MGKRTGRPTGRPKGSGVIPPAVRFWSKIDKRGPEECWEWIPPSRSKGYGIFYNGECNEQAHRFSYRTLIGPIPEGRVLDHLCRNTLCVNPAHLEPVTQRINLLRGDSRVAANAAKTHCHRGHPFSPENTRIVRGKHGLQRHCRACQARRDEGKYQRDKARKELATV